MASNERAFAIQASPDVIWRALRREVQAGLDSGRASLVREEAPRQLVLDVRMGWGLRVRYRYALKAESGHTEVAVQVAPYGIRHAVSNIISLGRGATPYMVAVTQGLSNLKAAAEADAQRST